jgi:hypothetical protein
LSLPRAFITCLATGCSLLFVSGVSAEEPPAPLALEAEDYFETRVRPVLVEKCMGCHGADKQKAGLRVDSLQALLAGGESGPAIVAGNPESSRLVHAINYTTGTLMPPDAKLPQEEIEAITEWVRMGAPWPESAAPAEGAEAPALSIEERVAQLRQSHWAFKPVEAPPAPEAPDPAWNANIVDRFVYAKLSQAGLPPSPEADKATLLRRLSFDLTGLPPTPEEIAGFMGDTASDAYERQVERLLASPRFGERWARYWLDVARYSDTKGYVFQEERDYAFSHTYRDYVVRAFNEDLPYDQFVKQQIAADQMELEDKRHLAAMGFLTLGRNFVGSIDDQIDDRIDVISRGFMGLTMSCARCHDHKYDPVPIGDYYSLYGVFRSSVAPSELPLIEDPDPEDPEYQAFQKAVAEKEAELQALVTELHYNMLGHAREKAAEYLRAGHEVRDTTDAEQLRTLARDRGLIWQLVEVWRDFLKEKAAAGGVDPIFWPWITFASLPAEGFDAAAKALYDEKMADPAFKDALNPVVLEQLQEAPQSLEHLMQQYHAIFQKAESAWTNQIASATQAAASAGTAPELPAALADANLESVRQVLYGASAPANVPRGNVFDYSDVPTQGRIRARTNARARVENTHPGRPDRAMVMTDAANLFDPYVFLRGKSSNVGPAVPRQAPILLALDRKPFEKGSGRLELAELIASRNNPLTPRVMVNRVWGNLFGKYLVDTPSDFGTRADAPTHPELLDALASEFMDNGWSVKSLVRRIVTSRTYRQSSMGREDGLEKDPENRLLWRQNRRRLDLEGMRDALLATAGTLDATMGGPAVEITGNNWSNRRTIYGRIERQNLPSLFRTFDFASPDAHTPRRFTTCVPQQALFLMNTPFVIEQARALARRLSLHDEVNAQAKVRNLYHAVYQRDPDPEEIALATSFFEQAEQAPSLDEPVWRYGYGKVDVEANKLASFTPLPNYVNGTYMGKGGNLPDPELGWVSLHKEGGHPGREHAAILRWAAPASGTVSVAGRLRHTNTAGDGVVGHVVSNTQGILWNGTAYNDRAAFKLENIRVQKGDTIDFAVSCGVDENSDSFSLSPRVTFTPEGGNESQQQTWLARRTFLPPAPQPLDANARYAQVLLLTNEFMFVD